MTLLPTSPDIPGTMRYELQEHSPLNQAPEEEDIETIVNDIPPSDRISYNNGDGDFFFGRIPSWEKKPITEDMSEEEKQELMGITGSNGVPIVELDGFQRSGPFPYTKLPFEIRQMILRILLGPIFFTFYNGDMEVEYTSFHIQSLQDPLDNDDNFNRESESLYAWSEQRARRRRDEMCYPGRKILYLLTLNPLRMGYRNLHKDWVFLEWIRQASHVSTSFRHELGQIMWANTEICAKGYEDNYQLDTVECFLRERPWVLAGIKSLVINLEISEGQDINKHGVFDRWCDYVAESLDLEELRFSKICVSERDMVDFVDGKGSGLNGLHATSKLRVSLGFFVTLEVGDDPDADIEEYEAMVLEYMMPLSLLSEAPETEEQ